MTCVNASSTVRSPNSPSCENHSRVIATSWPGVRSFGVPQLASSRAICEAKNSSVKRFPTFAVSAESIGDSCEVAERMVIDDPIGPKLSRTCLAI